MKAKFMVALLLTVVLAGCNHGGSGPGGVKGFDYGQVKDNRYTNSFFRLTMDLPANWVIQSHEQIKQMTEEGKKLVAGKDEKQRAAYDTSEINTAYLLSIFQHDKGDFTGYNPSMILIAENLSKFPRIKTGADYLAQSRVVLLHSRLKYSEVSATFPKVKINNTEFYEMDAELPYAGFDIKQKYFTRVIGNFSFNVIISYINDAQEQELMKSVNSMKFH